MSAMRKIRDRLGVTQAEMAVALGCSQGNVSFYERGQTVPPDVAGKLIEFAKTKGHTVSYDDIYAGAENDGQRSAARDLRRRDGPTGRDREQKPSRHREQ